MDISAVLTVEEIAALSDPNRTCEDATLGMKQVGQPSIDQRWKYDTGTFEESIRLKNTIDMFEEQVQSSPSWKCLSIILNCEYQLFVANQDTPLRHNPFLSHWVEAVQRLARESTQNGRLAVDPTNYYGSLNSVDVGITRLELIKSLLQSHNPTQFAQLSPKQLHKNFVQLKQTTSLDVRRFIQMLEEEGVYERGSSVDEDSKLSHKQSTETMDKVADKPKLSNKQQWNQEMMLRLEQEPEVAVPELTHLPIELLYLDFLTTLLQDKTLQRLSIEPAPVIHDYIQHALRIVEQMGQPPGPSSVEPSSAWNGQDTEIVGHGRDAQARAVKLLLLFIRNLIRKALLPPESIYYEIQEICVRYVWIREVREFRKFIEEGSPLSEQLHG
ncbi:hypothetical protein CC78DRAFT_297533 [Lojkania enalia]|uniref:CCR4-NOT transcription complex subunit 11 n=1 Tax=Lojkania enalia TaxID=147567 RepID=A0A9P4N7S6_9PLEO|nr:hypothetical protein CC78DRAFT_297533 [Didymosphaeria enalia]